MFVCIEHLLSHCYMCLTHGLGSRIITCFLSDFDFKGLNSQVRARATDLRLAAAEGSNLLEGRDVHIHFPAGAVPKDGPSAGVTLVTSLVSLFSQKSVRSDTAMTGEMTLRGLVLPVGGVKDKVKLSCASRRLELQ